MRNILGICLLLSLTGCPAATSIVPPETKVKDTTYERAQYELELQSLVEKSHSEEMELLKSQQQLLVDIKESIDAVAKAQLETSPPSKTEDESISELAKKPEINKTQPVTDTKPTLWITYADSPADPASIGLKNDIKAGLLSKFQLKEVAGDDLEQETRPAIRFKWSPSNTGWGVLYGWHSANMQWLRENLLYEAPTFPLAQSQKTSSTSSVVISPPVTYPEVIYQTSPNYVNWGGRLYNPATYGGCSNLNCAMCRTIRAGAYQPMVYLRPETEINDELPVKQEDLPAAQQATPDDVIDEALEALQLTEDDVLADFGCGDARILVRAVTRYKCRAVGIELDPKRLREARRQLAKLDRKLANRITLIEGDALTFSPENYHVTAAVAYLYPPLLEKLSPKLRRLSRVVTPFHAVPGLKMTSRGSIWIYSQSF